MLFDGTHGLSVNSRTRLRDQERAPIAADLKRAMRADVLRRTGTVGTFGVASASFYWSRVAAAIGRLSQYILAHICTTWHMLVVDDFLLECGGPKYRCGLILFFVLCASVGAPLSWHKTGGGDTLIWVGFELLLRSRSIGMSSRRAEWFAD